MNDTLNNYKQLNHEEKERGSFNISLNLENSNTNSEHSKNDLSSGPESQNNSTPTNHSDILIQLANNKGSGISKDSAEDTHNSYSGTQRSERTFVLSQNIDWSKTAFKIYELNGEVAYFVTNEDKDFTMTQKEILMKVGSTGEKKLQVSAVECLYFTGSFIVI